MLSRLCNSCRPAVLVLIALFTCAVIMPPTMATNLNDYCSDNAQQIPYYTFTTDITQVTDGRGFLSSAATKELLQRDGIILTSDPPNTIQLADDRSVYGGGVIKGVNNDVLMQTGVQGPVSFTLTFIQPISAFAFARAALFAGPNGITHPAWTATAYAADRVVVASTQEAEIRSYSNVPHRTFNLAGSQPIRSITFSANNHHFDAFANVVISAFMWCK